MQNILIIDNNISYIQNLIRSISQTITNLKLYNFYINKNDKIYSDIKNTRCIESGMAPVVVQKLMGHTDVSVTLNTYTSVFDKFKEKELDKVNKYYLEENMLNAVKLLEEFENSEKEL